MYQVSLGLQAGLHNQCTRLGDARSNLTLAVTWCLDSTETHRLIDGGGLFPDDQGTNRSAVYLAIRAFGMWASRNLNINLNFVFTVSARFTVGSVLG